MGQLTDFAGKTAMVRKFTDDGVVIWMPEKTASTAKPTKRLDDLWLIDESMRWYGDFDGNVYRGERDGDKATLIPSTQVVDKQQLRVASNANDALPVKEHQDCGMDSAKKIIEILKLLLAELKR